MDPIKATVQLPSYADLEDRIRTLEKELVEKQEKIEELSSENEDLRARYNKLKELSTVGLRPVLRGGLESVVRKLYMDPKGLGDKVKYYRRDEFLKDPEVQEKLKGTRDGADGESFWDIVEYVFECKLEAESDSEKLKKRKDEKM